MPEEQITIWGGESINVASLKTTTILSQQMAKWQYNALLTLWQGHQALVPFYPPERGKQKNPSTTPQSPKSMSYFYIRKNCCYSHPLLRYVLWNPDDDISFHFNESMQSTAAGFILPNNE